MAQEQRFAGNVRAGRVCVSKTRHTLVRSLSCVFMLTKLGAQFLRGFTMGSADIVPGVSGGTIALIFGIYDQLVNCIRTGARALGLFARADFRGGVERLKGVDWGFLIPLGLGILAALLVLTRVIESALESNPIEIAGLFFGLIVASIWVAWGILKERDLTRLAMVVLVGLAVFFLLGLRSISEPGQVRVTDEGSGETYDIYFEADSAEITPRGERGIADLSRAIDGGLADGDPAALSWMGYMDGHDTPEKHADGELGLEGETLTIDRVKAAAEALRAEGHSFELNSWGTAIDRKGKPKWQYFAAGALAICAMILPGISGSLILVLLAMYQPVLSAVHDRDLASLGIFVIGAIVGLALFSQILHWLLEHHHDTTIAALIGLMVGSLRILWPWDEGIDGTALNAPGEPVAMPIILGLVAAAVVLGLSRLARRGSVRGSAEVG